MGRLAVGFGAVLVLLGIGAYIASGAASMTSMIPAFFGVPIAACGFVAMNPARAKPAGIAAIVIATLGVMGSLSRIVPALVRGESIDFGLATIVQLAFAAIAGAFVVLAVLTLRK